MNRNNKAGHREPDRRLAVRWNGRVARFSRMREGGPGKPQTLLLLLVAGAAMLHCGISLTDANTSNAGPPLILLSFFPLLFVPLWVVLKVVLRSTEVTFEVNAKGISLLPSPQQQALDRRMRWLALLVFWATLKGGQWAAWAPFTPWKDVRRIDYDDANHEILVQGGSWDIRLMCADAHYAEVRSVIALWRRP